MRANELTYEQKLIGLSFLISQVHGGFELPTAYRVFGKLYNIPIRDVIDLFAELKVSYRLLDGDIYFWDGKLLFLITRDRVQPITQPFFDLCSPEKRTLIRQVRGSFKFNYHPSSSHPRSAVCHDAAESWISEAWMHKNVKQTGGDESLIGRSGKVVETMFDENGALHCRMSINETDTNNWWWCPALYLTTEQNAA